MMRALGRLVDRETIPSLLLGTKRVEDMLSTIKIFFLISERKNLIRSLQVVS